VSSLIEDWIWDERLIENDQGCECWDIQSSGKISSMSDIISDVCYSVQRKVSTFENTIRLREKKTIMKKPYRSPN